MILLQNRVQIAAVRVHCPVQHPRQVAEFPVRPDEADRCPGDGAADQRINDTRQRDFKALAKQVKAQQHQQRNKHRGMGVLHVTEGKKQHAGQDDQQQLPFNRGNQQQDRQADRHPNQRADNPQRQAMAGGVIVRLTDEQAG